MKTYRVKVKVTKYEYYQIEAISDRDALDNWGDGEFVNSTPEETQPIFASLAT
jgi:hypothetical protein